MPTDPELSASETQAGDTDTDETSSTTQKVDYESKYKGEAKRNSKLQKQIDTLQSQYDEALAQKEESDSKYRSANKGIEKATKEVQDKLTAKEKELADTLKELNSLKQLAEARKIVSKDYPQLTEALDAGDLKLQQDFTSPEDYQAYLKRMADRMGAKSAEPEDAKEEETDETTQADEYETQYRHVSGATPSLKTSTRDSKNARTSKQIETEMWNIDTSTKEGKKKFAQLEIEQNEALKREGILAPR